MEKVKLKEAISKMVKEELNEIKFPPNVQKGIDFHKGYSSGTITSDGVTNMLKSDLEVYNNYFDKIRE